MRTLTNSHRWTSIALVMAGLSCAVAISVNETFAHKAAPAAMDFRPQRKLQDIPKTSGVSELENVSQHSMRLPTESTLQPPPLAISEATMTASDTPGQSTFSAQATDVDGVDETGEPLALKALKTMCSTCGPIVDHLRKYAVSANTIEDLTAIGADANYQNRLAIENVCPGCLDAIEFAEDSMFGRLLSVDEMQALIASPTLASLKEAACTAGYTVHKRPNKVFALENGSTCEIGNSVDAKN